MLNVGVVNEGMAIHFAAEIPSVFTSPINIAATYPITNPPKIAIRPKKPREKAEMSAIDASVITPITGPAVKLFFAAPARLRPITITMVPVTTGGKSQSIQPVPEERTIKPITARITPVATTPPRAVAMPSLLTEAAIGAKKANEEPR
ncbi:unannotated protein [freshwater metagenome]|uniref:Unannotated protein n=1 Tax=freshwater metagenome TaxID=449393 RepID=A0A6J6XHE1_9ZZZZ